MTMTPRYKQLIVTAALLPVLFNPLFLHAQTASDIASASKTELEQQLAEIEKQISLYEKQLTQTQGEKKTLTTAISKLKAQQSSLQLQIKSTTLKINDLNKKLNVTEKQITVTKNKQAVLAREIGAILRVLNVRDQEILLESLSSKNGLAEVAQNIDSYAKIFTTLSALTDQTKAVHQELKKQQDIYEVDQDDAEKLLAIKSAQQTALLNKLDEQSDLLNQTKGQESNYQKILTDAKTRANQIRNRIYDLVGTVSGKQIDFAEAVRLADYASSQTGVPTAFLLAILTQESSLGKNVGTCNRAGDPPEKSWKVVMKPDRDQAPFKTITDELGLNIDTTPVSCPLKDSKGKPYGWGGAMGPAQFIPSTWMGYRAKITAITGKPGNPWDIKDAFLAAAIKLKADGADKTENGQWTAAMKYFAGSVNLKYRFYGDNVLATAKKYAADIDQIRTANFNN